MTSFLVWGIVALFNYVLGNDMQLLEWHEIDVQRHNKQCWSCRDVYAKLNIVLICEDHWPVYTSYTEDKKLRKEKLNKKYDKSK